MKRFAAFGFVCVACLLWSVHNAANMSPQFPEPMKGYSSDLVTYDDLPPANPVRIDLGAIQFNADNEIPVKLPNMDAFDGIEIKGRLEGGLCNEAVMACIAVDITRQSKEEHQLIASRSDFFELNNESATFCLAVRLPDCSETMQVSLIAILLNGDEVPVSAETVLAKGSFTHLAR